MGHIDRHKISKITEQFEKNKNPVYKDFKFSSNILMLNI